MASKNSSLQEQMRQASTKVCNDNQTNGGNIAFKVDYEHSLDTESAKFVEVFWIESELVPACTEVAQRYAEGLLHDYTTFLQNNGYLDTDATEEKPTAVKRFLQSLQQPSQGL